MAKIDSEETRFGDQLAGMESVVAESRAKVDPDLLAKYDALWKQIKRPPVLVPLVDQICGGCHLRVSNEIAATAESFEIVHCDSCGRMLYIE